MMTAVTEPAKPGFLRHIRAALGCRRNLQVLTGDTTGLFWSESQRKYVSLDVVLREELSGDYLVLALDMLGVTPFSESDLDALRPLLSRAADKEKQPGLLEGLLDKERKSREDPVVAKFAEARYAPLTAMNLLRTVFAENDRASLRGKTVRPICVIIRHASALFPSREMSGLDQQDRQRLVFFLNLVLDPGFMHGRNAFLLIESSLSEINDRISSLGSCEHVEVPLPDREERRLYLDRTWPAFKDLLDVPVAQFLEGTAGLPLAQLDDMLQGASARGGKVGKKDVTEAVNLALRSMLGEIVTFKSQDHSLSDVIGYDSVKDILADIFQDCDDPKTAVSGILVSGPNGVGKTWLIEAAGFESGWTVIELSGLRNERFGGTERFFEKFRMVVSTFGRILVEVDEAHTAFGSVHSGETHEVEKRLAGNIIKMMGNPAYHGRILWILMTSRPDELDPDVKSRCPIQVPLFDLEGQPRKEYLSALFTRKGIGVTDEEMARIEEVTRNYSNRDLDFLVKIYLGRKRRKPELTVPEFLNSWRAGASIRRQREFQELLASQHCSFPQLLPERLSKLTDEQRAEKLQGLSWELQQ